MSVNRQTFAAEATTINVLQFEILKRVAIYAVEGGKGEGGRSFKHGRGTSSISSLRQGYDLVDESA